MAVSPIFIGVLFAVMGNVLMGASMVMKKRAINKRKAQAGLVDTGFFSHWIFRVIPDFSSFVLFAGEALNFVGYVKAPAYLIVLIGSVNVLTSQLLSSFFLGDYLSGIRIAGTAFIGAGVSLLVISSPQNENGAIDDFLPAVSRLIDEVPIIMFSVAGAIIIELTYVMYVSHRDRRAQPYIIPLTTYAASACFMVITTKIIATLILDAFNHVFYFKNAMSYLLWPWWLFCAAMQLRFLKATLASDAPASTIVPLMYVCYATTGMFTSGIYFNEFGTREIYQLVLLMVSIGSIFTGVYCVTRDAPRERGFWCCCPQFPFHSEFTAKKLNLDLVYPVERDEEQPNTDPESSLLQGVDEK